MKIKVYEKNSILYDDLEKDIRDSKKEVLIETYIYKSDSIGRHFNQLLTQKARAGVKISLLLDNIGSFGTYRNFFRELTVAGGTVRYFHDNWALPGFFKNLNRRDHNKLFIIDDRVAYMGSTNIYDDGYGMDDISVRIEENCVQTLKKFFFENFNQAEKSLNRQYQQSFRCDNYLILRDIPGFSSSLQKNISRLFKNALQEILITTPYPIFNRNLRNHLVQAAKQGIAVKLILPITSDIKIIDLFRFRHFGQLIAAGCQIWFLKSKKLHGKAMLIDQKTALISSSNFDYRGLLHNFELTLVGSEPELVNQLSGVFGNLLNLSTPYLISDWKKRSLLHRLMETLLQPIRHHL